MRNQTMLVKIKGFGNIVIGHKNKLAKVSDVLAVGNSYRASIGEKPITSLQSYFRKPSTWRTIIAIHNKMVEKVGSYGSYLENIDKKVSSAMHYLDIETTMKSLPRVKDRNWIDYKTILKSKQFNHIIKVQHGGKVENRGYYVNLWLMIDIAMMMNEEFKVELIDIFIENKILEYRDGGGEAYKKLNILIDKTLTNAPKAPWRYIYIANLTKEVIGENKPLPKGYNQEEHDAIIQKRREKIIDTSCTMIKMNIVKTYQQLEDFIINFPL